MIEIEYPEPPYMILQSLPHIKENNSMRLIYIIKVNSDETHTFKIGRQSSNDISINDITVSRTHAFIHFKNNNFYIEDNSSKFGTSVKISSALEIPVKQTVGIQVDRTLLVCRLEEKPSGY